MSRKSGSGRSGNKNGESFGSGLSRASVDAEAKGDGRRIHRVEKEIREVIATYLQRGFRGDLPGMISVSRVIASKDLRNAKVLVTLLLPSAAEGEPQDDAAWNERKKQEKIAHKTAVRELQEHAAEIQFELNRRLQMKHCPRLTFIYDEGFDRAMKIENLIRDLGRNRNAASADDPDSDHEEN